jgi:hypothetical protein
MKKKGEYKPQCYLCGTELNPAPAKNTMRAYMGNQPGWPTGALAVVCGPSCPERVAGVDIGTKSALLNALNQVWDPSMVKEDAA